MLASESRRSRPSWAMQMPETPPAQEKENPALFLKDSPIETEEPTSDNNPLLRSLRGQTAAMAPPPYQVFRPPSDQITSLYCDRTPLVAQITNLEAEGTLFYWDRAPLVAQITKLEVEGTLFYWDRAPLVAQIAKLDAENTPVYWEKAPLFAEIAKMEAELYDHQYNMGLLLMERKEWDIKSEKLREAVVQAEDNLRKHIAANNVVKSEFRKHEESLKKAVMIEKQCVGDIEKALREMRSEAADLKVSTENKFTQAKDTVTTIESKLHLADTKLQTAEALQAEASRKHEEMERKLKEVEAQEAVFRREKVRLKAEQEACESELHRLKYKLQETEKKLQEDQDRLLKGQLNMNQRDDLVSQKENALKRTEFFLEDRKKGLEKERAALKQLETDANSRMAAVEAREQKIIDKEIYFGKKQQQLLLSQERVASKERAIQKHENHVKMIETLQEKEKLRLEALGKAIELEEEALHELKRELRTFERSLDQQKPEIDSRKAEYQTLKAEAEKRHRLLSFEKEKLNDLVQTQGEKEAAMEQREEDLCKKEQEVDEEGERLIQKETEVDAKTEQVKQRSKALKRELNDIMSERRVMPGEMEALRKSGKEIESTRAILEAQRSRIEEERERFESRYPESEELRTMRAQLKEGLDGFWALMNATDMEAELLWKKRDEAERERDLLDKRIGSIRKEAERVEQEKCRMLRWIQDEERRVEQEKGSLRNQVGREMESLRLEKEFFISIMEQDKLEWIKKAEKQKLDLATEVDMQSRVVERNMGKWKEDIEKQLDEREAKLKKETLAQIEHLSSIRASAENEQKLLHSEMIRLRNGKQELLKYRREMEKERVEIKKDIKELQDQSGKLQEQREGLKKDRGKLIDEIKNLQKMKGKEGSPNKCTPLAMISIKPPKSAEMPEHMSWLKRCASLVFTSPENKQGRGGINGSTEIDIVLKDLMPSSKPTCGVDGESQKKRDDRERTNSIGSYMGNGKRASRRGSSIRVANASVKDISIPNIEGEMWRDAPTCSREYTRASRKRGEEGHSLASHEEEEGDSKGGKRRRKYQGKETETGSEMASSRGVYTRKRRQRETSTSVNEEPDTPVSAHRYNLRHPIT